MKVTKKEQEALHALQVYNDVDMLSQYPFRYEQRELVPFENWNVEDKVVFEAQLISPIRTSRFGKRTISRFEVLLNQQISLKVTIYNRPWLASIKQGSMMTLFGKYDGNNRVTANQYNLQPLQEQLGIQPIYHLKEGITAKKFTALVKEALTTVQLDEIIPTHYRQKYRLLSRKQAYLWIHFPQTMEQVKQAIRTLKYEEFLLFQIIVLNRKQLLLEEGFGVPKQFSYDEVFGLVNQLPFSLTKGQFKSVIEILDDLQSERRMYRLLQGDVGSGKTLVAATAIYATFLSGKQSAFMVPTEILAKQQMQYFKEFFKHTDLKVDYLVSAMNSKVKKEVIEKLKSGGIDLIVGTHALIQDAIEFANLGLVITDEQHRFGVEQRNKLKEKGSKVDYLLMSATPIPRTLAGILFGDMEISTIDTVPLERKPIITHYVQQNSMISFLDTVLTEIEDGNRCYVVCPAIEDSKETAMRNVTDIYNALTEEIQKKRMKPFQIGLLHGKLSSEEKEIVMQEFKEGKIQILVTTTVIEVGINVKEANIMVIYDAHRFGLSQLHQLRGRVGRGSIQGVCYLLSDATDEAAINRLQFLATTTDGFEIAKYDLSVRGPGDVLGIRQSGLPSFVLGDFISDYNIVTTARGDAEEIIHNTDQLENRKVIEYALQKWQSTE